MYVFIKPCTPFNNSSSSSHLRDAQHEKPSVCPHCGFGTDAVAGQYGAHALHDDSLMLFSSCTCTSCNKRFFYASHLKRGETLAKLACVFPSNEPTYQNEVLNKISPKFIDLYNQSLRAEHRGDIELAATGYRSALECLIKEFAITELNEPKDEVITKNLNNSISKYLKQESLVNSADVIRVLGNDFTHYERKYPEHDFDMLKDYMDIFISLIATEYKIKHPPVGRNAPKE